MHQAHRPARAAFTLIELLMVILIVGLLASLLLVAVNAGLKTAQKAAIQTEIDQLAMAVETFKTDKGTYPPTMSVFLRGGGDAAKEQRLMRAVAKIFPRYAADYAKFGNDVIEGTKFSRAGGLNIENLDPAESLVFWLGGIPDPNSETKLVGFRNDPANPFRFNGDSAATPATPGTEYLKNRAATFPFDPARLVDRDNDGWLEYIPKGKAEGDMPPFVYFDSGSYDMWPFYPDSLTFDPTALALWGNAIPYASDDSARGIIPDNSTSLATVKPQWLNSKKFQIITPGRDGSYGRRISTSLLASPTVPEIFNELRLWPTCTYLTKDPSGPGLMLLPDTELDNQTNLSTSLLGDDRP